jgi:hypothetical protein
MAKRSRKELSHEEHKDLQRKNSRREPRIDPRKAGRTGGRQIPTALASAAVLAMSTLQSTCHSFPLVIFVLFVAKNVLPDLYQSAMSPCRLLVPAEGRTGCFVCFVVKILLSDRPVSRFPDCRTGDFLFPNFLVTTAST